MLIGAVLASLLAFAPAADAHTLSYSTAWARLNRSITQTYVAEGWWIVYRGHGCWRVDRHRVTCRFTLTFEGNSYVCGLGRVKEIVTGAIRARVWWRASDADCS
jgi:hypothetical protein